jgi:hypothetical protein
MSRASSCGLSLPLRLKLAPVEAHDRIVARTWRLSIACACAGDPRFWGGVGTRLRQHGGTHNRAADHRQNLERCAPRP